MSHHSPQHIVDSRRQVRLRAKNWGEFQHYKKRAPPWIKLHRDLLDNFEWHRLHDASKALAPMLWLLASEYEDGVINTSVDEIAFRLRMEPAAFMAALKPLIDSDFFTDERDASDSLASRKQNPLSETESETESEGEGERAGARERRGSAGHEQAETALPPDWGPSMADLEWAKTERPDLGKKAIDEQTTRFRNQAAAKGWRNVDWSAAWRNWILRARTVAARGHPPEERAAMREPLRLTGAETRGTLLLRGHKPGDAWKPANGPAPESDLDNPEIDPDQRRQWRRYYGLPASWAGLQRAEAGP